MFSNPEDRKRIRKVLGEISDSMTRIEAERNLISQTLDLLVEEYDIPKKTFSKLSKLNHKANADQEFAALDELETIYEEVFKLGE